MDNEHFNLLYYCIMKNHVHMIIDTGMNENPFPQSTCMKLLKGSNSRNINLALKRTVIFWPKDSYDHLIRSDIELGRIGDYILENPVKADLVSKWEEWPNTFVKYL
ncbi:MAG: transposase [Saprospiraceae bacterium]